MLTAEIARLVGVTPETVRFYTRKKLLHARKNPTNGYKEYDQNAVERLRFINHARSIGFSLKQITDIIEQSEQGTSPCPKVRSLLLEQIQQTKQKITQYQQHLALMEATYQSWQGQPDTIPDGKAICCLIEEWSDKHPGAMTKGVENEQV
ncbi:MerR family transcriptional regulator [Marinomonas sp.]